MAKAPGSSIDVDDLIGQRRVAGCLDLTSRRRVMTGLAGVVSSGFTGRGIDFDELRPYQPGDEARSIDWRVTARTRRPHVRVYREERERPVLLLVDLRPPMWFGTRTCFKAVLAARAAALFAWAAVANGDSVGGLSFGRGLHAQTRARGGVRGALQFVHALAEGAAASGTEGSEGFADALQRLLRMARGGSLVAIFSDFRQLSPEVPNLVRRLARSTELVLGFVHDPLEVELPPAGYYPLASPTGQPAVLLDTSGGHRRTQWREAFARRRQAARALGGSSYVHWLELGTERSVADAMRRTFTRTAAG